ncbi:MAG: ABC transporter ATP-binding protein [Spirochaetota bacterium]
MNVAYDVQVDNVCFSYPEEKISIFNNLSLKIPHGVVSFMGQNGIGKSTLLLLCGGRILPNSGDVTILGKNTKAFKDEEEKNEFASFIYQNMEFETEDSIGTLLNFVYESGFWVEKDPSLIKILIDTFELKHVLTKKTQEISKGELQRTIIAFGILYGSKVVLMDEPIFALENYQKERTMKFLMEFARENNVSLYYSVHELDISRRYSEYLVLFFKDGTIKTGPTHELLTRSNLEEAYQIPYGLLYNKEYLYRWNLMALNDKERDRKKGQDHPVQN